MQPTAGWGFGDTHIQHCSCWQTSVGQSVLLEYGTGCEWYPSNQTLQCSVVTIRCYPWSAISWQVFHIFGLCVFSHQSTDYSIVVAHLTSNNFEGHPCCMHVDYLPIDYSKNNATLKRCAHRVVTIMSKIDYSRITQNSIWSPFQFGYLSPVFKKKILSKHGTKANIRSTKMANNRHACSMDVLQSYWTLDELPLCCSQSTGEKTHTNLRHNGHNSVSTSF
jgi:hypothetical protein